MDHKHPKPQALKNEEALGGSSMVAMQLTWTTLNYALNLHSTQYTTRITPTSTIHLSLKSGHHNR